MKLLRRKPTRLKYYEYSASGVYFITICTQDRRCILSEIVGEGLAPPETRLTGYGKIADGQLSLLRARFPSVSVEKYVIMPNHIHLLLRLNVEAGGASPSPTISTVIGVFKSQTTRLSKFGGKRFQRSFYDHIVRGEKDYWEIWGYIDANPAKWKEDCFYSGRS